MDSSIKIFVVAVAGCGSAGAVGLGVYKHYNYTTIEEKLRGALLSTKDKEDEKPGKARLDSLKKHKDGNLVPSLKTIKDKDSNAVETDLKDWCVESVKSKFNNENELLFRNVQKYCTYSIKEKLGSANIVEENTQDTESKLSILFSNLASTDVSKLSKLFRDIKSTQNTSNHEGNKALKAKCKSVYEYPFLGEEYLEFKNAKKFCILPA